MSWESLSVPLALPRKNLKKHRRQKQRFGSSQARVRRNQDSQSGFHHPKCQIKAGPDELPRTSSERSQAQRLHSGIDGELCQGRRGHH